MYMRLLPLLLPVMLVALLVGGCDRREDIASAPDTVQPMDPDSLVNAWLELAHANNGDLDIEAAHEITGQLNLSEVGLEPLFDIMADPDADPMVKVLVVISATPYVTNDHAALLLDLTSAEHEQTTRSCAANLLGVLDEHPEATARLRELMADEDNYTVQVAAILALMQNRDPDALARAMELWENPQTTIEQRTQIVYLIPSRQVFDYFEIFKDAATNPEIEFSARRRAVSVVAQADDPAAIPILEQVAQQDSSEDIRRLAIRGRIAMEERIADMAPSDNPVD